MIISHVPDTRLGDCLTGPLSQTFRCDPDEFTRGLVTCISFEHCDLAMIDTTDRALEVVQALKAQFARV